MSEGDREREEEEMSFGPFEGVAALLTAFVSLFWCRCFMFS